MGGGGSEVTLARGALAALPELLARLSFVAFGTRAVEVLLHAVTRGLVLTRVGLARVGPARDLRTSGGRGRRFRSQTTPTDERRHYAVTTADGG